jgi:aspartyl-tRNA(Asn)/glutamyl-tRNA(Gln) amidotransferase subunit A
MMPTKFGELVNDPIKNMMADLYTVTVSIVGLPSLSLPCGFSTSGLPIGMQLVGGMFTEGMLLSMGAEYQAHTGWHTMQPLLLSK